MSPASIAIVGLLVGPLSCACPTWLIHRAGLSRASAEFFILGLPFMFKRDVDPKLNLSVHFVVSGAEPGSYYVVRYPGVDAPAVREIWKHPGSIIYCSTDSWNLVARGALSPGRAVARGLLRIVGSAEDYTRFFECFELATRVPYPMQSLDAGRRGSIIPRASKQAAAGPVVGAGRNLTTGIPRATAAHDRP